MSLKSATYFFSIFVLACITRVVCGESYTVHQKVENQNALYTIDIPDGWTFYTEEVENDLAAFDPVLRIFVGVGHDAFPTYLTTGEYIKLQIEQMKIMLGASKIKVKEIVHNGRTWSRMICDVNKDDAHAKMKSYTTFHDGIVYFVFAISPDFSKEKNIVVNGIVKSFAIVE